MFKALVLNQADGHTTAAIETLDESRLPAGDVTVAVEYSTINYKDGLALTNAIKIVQQYPMVPGIDFAGTVIESAHPRYRSGDKVILTGWGVGEKHWGGLAEKARVNGDWLVPLPAALSTRQAMIIGTAGFTAMLCVQALADQHITPERGEILVTGASGGVGSVAITLLNKLGYRVAAVTGRPTHYRARRIGAAGQAARIHPLGRRGRHRRLANIGQSAGANRIRRRCGRLRPGRRHGSAHHGDAVYLAQREAYRRRFRVLPLRKTRGRLAESGRIAARKLLCRRQQ
ncbi:MAG TPA: oxidoreductase [Neisseria sp.]|nr:oxidoreductase [Neisseria sp.]